MIQTAESGRWPVQGARAGLVSRTTAGIVDAITILLILVIGYLAVSAVLFSVRPRRFSLPAPGRSWILLIALGVAVCYLSFGWYLSGRTPGKQLAGLRVVTTSGDPLSFRRALARAFLCMVFPIGLLWTAVSVKGSSAQDLLLRTSVIYDWKKGNMPP